jgi:hypothetical protein
MSIFCTPCARSLRDGLARLRPDLVLEGERPDHGRLAGHGQPQQVQDGGAAPGPLAGESLKVVRHVCVQFTQQRRATDRVCHEPRARHASYTQRGYLDTGRRRQAQA